MPLTRDAVIAVLMKHHTGICGGADLIKDSPQLVSELCALTTTPSREALERHLDKWTWPTVSIAQRIDVSIAQRIEWLMAWASGTFPERQWCSDIRWGVFGRQTNWVWSAPSDERLETDDVVPTTWRFCPRCAAPRPSAG